MDANQIIRETIDYSINFIEKPHPVFGNAPVCPFAKKFRVEGKIKYMVMPFSLSEEIDPQVLMLAEIFNAQHKYDSYFVIHPDKTLNLQELIRFCDKLQNHIKSMGLILFRGHPLDDFKIGGVHTRREPYPGFQLLRESLILETRGRLAGSYFSHWSQDALVEVGITPVAAPKNA